MQAALNDMDFTVATFEERPDLFNAQSGNYVVEGALCPVAIDKQLDLGRYVEPNVWVSYDLNPT
jgi:hypothetical protein